MTLSDWKDLAETKRNATLASIPKEWRLTPEEITKHRENILDAPNHYLTEKELEITEIESAVELAQKLAAGSYTSLEVAKAFMHRASIAAQLTNCSTEIFFDAGIERAKYLDEYLAENGKPLGPFHGLPISLKDTFNVPGIDSTLGYVSYIGNAHKLSQSALAKLLEDNGAVFYIKTNIPQTLMTADSENNIFGRTLNPNNPKLTAGGLSGGEGAIVKQKGSILGVGTDIAGLIRIPSMCCGVYGFKPTVNRVPYSKQTDLVEPLYLGVNACAGPLAKSFKDLEFFFKNVLNAEPWSYDYNALAVPYTEPRPKEKLVIGLVLEDPDLPVHPPVRENLEVAAQKLESEGHTIVRLSEFPSFDDAWRVAMSQYCILVDGEPTALDPLINAGEPLIKSLSQSGIEHYVPKVPNTLEETVKVLREGAKIGEKWAKIFQSNKLDALIAPVAPSTAPPHDTYGIAPYTALWSLVNYPALAIPYGVTEKEYNEETERYPEHLKGIYAHYNNGDYKGGLGSIQVVAPTNMDEKLLAAGKVIDRILNGKN